MLTCFTYRPTVVFARSSVGTLAAVRGGMPDYRAYLIGEDGHFYDAVPLVCTDDAEAISKARPLAINHDVELWRLDRKVATFPSQKKSP